MLHGGPVFAVLAKIHLWTTIVVTPVIVGHLLVVIGMLPGYRGVWRAMFPGGRVSEETARRVSPGWTERMRSGPEPEVDEPTQEPVGRPSG